jgi:hypothetical protein
MTHNSGNGTGLASCFRTPTGCLPTAEELMNLLLPSLCALGLAAGNVSLAQTPQPAAPPEPAEQQATEVSEADMQKFAEIYVDVETTRVELVEELHAAEQPVAAEEAQVRLQEELVATIEQHGWSVDRYNRVATAISNDPEKRDKTVKLINRIVSG